MAILRMHSTADAAAQRRRRMLLALLLSAACCSIPHTGQVHALVTPSYNHYFQRSRGPATQNAHVLTTTQLAAVVVLGDENNNDAPLFGAPIRPFPSTATADQENGTEDNESWNAFLEDLKQNMLSGQVVAIDILREWAGSRTIEGARRAEELLQWLQGQTVQDEALQRNLAVTQRHYTIVLDAYISAGDLDKAKILLLQMIKDKGISKIEGNSDSAHIVLNVLLHAYVRQNNAVAAAALLKDMAQSSLPRIVDYQVVLTALAKKGHATAARDLVTHMEQQQHKAATQPNLVSYNLLLEAFQKQVQNQANSARAVSTMLQQMESVWSRIQESFTPNIDSYTSMIQALASAAATTDSTAKDRKKWAEKARNMWEDAIANNMDVAAEGKNTLKSTMLLSMMNMYANLQTDSAARSAEQLLLRFNEAMLVDCDNDDNDKTTSTVAYNTLLKAWRHNLVQSERVFQDMRNKELANTLSYTTYLSTLAQSIGKKGNENKKGEQKSLTQKAQALLDEMSASPHVQPNTWTYNSVLHCWSNCNVARAEQLLKEMEQSKDCQPTTSSYTTVMNGWARAGGDRDKNLSKMQSLFDRNLAYYERHGKNLDCKPNQFTYTTLIHAYARTRTASGALKAEALLRDMYEQYKKDEKSKSRQADRLIPNTQLITSVMDCWQKSGAPDAGQRAEFLLNWMIVKSKAKETKVVDADTSVLAIRPNAHSFSSAISAWARTRTAGKASRARKLLVLMKQMHENGQIESPPNSYCYTNVINSCAYCIQEEDEKKLSLAIAVQTYKEMLKDENVQPSHVTFSTFLTALRNLLPSDDKRTAAVQTVFETAKESGQVDPLVIQKLQAVLPASEFDKLIPSACIGAKGEILAKNIPSEWNRNVS